jgi:hypothetical protein
MTDPNPFGRVHDYISVTISDSSTNENVYFSVSDGTTTLYMDKLEVLPSSNHSKPHQVNSASGYILLTSVQLQKLLSEYMRLFTQLYNSEDKAE